MFLPKSHIHLDADDLARSAAFYEALLGSPPARLSDSVAIFEFDSPPLVLTLEQRGPAARAKVSPRGNVRHLRKAHDDSVQQGTYPRFALVVNEPAQVGRAAIALRRAGVQLRLEDEGIEAWIRTATPGGYDSYRPRRAAPSSAPESSKRKRRGGDEADRENRLRCHSRHMFVSLDKRHVAVASPGGLSNLEGGVSSELRSNRARDARVPAHRIAAAACRRHIR